MAWFAVNTLPHQESRAELNLRRQGFQVFLPRFRKSRRHSRKSDSILAPFFPGYLFVTFEIGAQPWSSINSTYGVRSLIMCDDKPARVPKGFVETLQSSVDSEGVLDMAELNVKPGDRVILIEGPFVDCVATLLKVKVRKRVEVLLSILGGRFSVVMPSHSITPVA